MFQKVSTWFICLGGRSSKSIVLPSFYRITFEAQASWPMKIDVPPCSVFRKFPDATKDAGKRLSDPGMRAYEFEKFPIPDVLVDH